MATEEMGGWVIQSERGFWCRTANAQHSDAVGEWVRDPRHASVYSDHGRAQAIADQVGGEVYDYAAAVEDFSLEAGRF